MNNVNIEGKGEWKAEAAKKGILSIAPYANVEAVNLKIPMPGHFISQ